MSRTRVYATEAIILRRADYGEADRLLTLMTPHLGKLRVIAKGARKITSRKAGHIELFARVRLLLARGRSFDIVSQAELIEPHRSLREDVLRGSYAHYLSELIDQFAREGEEDAPLYDLFANGLMWVCQASKPALAARYFEMRLLTIAGYRPQLFRCAQTQTPLEIDQLIAVAQTIRLPSTAFSPTVGGVLCEKAAVGVKDALPLAPATLFLMRALQTMTFDEMAARAGDYPEHALQQTERAMRQYLSYVLERSLRSTRLITEIELDRRSGDPYQSDF
ncbi:MAG: DNA repair protein RecO [Anaerolineae bacterium]|nr:DNA repair protein RecO [Thermoflexales bacterium]MDW8407466.1 DNA repair protein RecO [Anaerolineae bacterium]